MLNLNILSALTGGKVIGNASIPDVGGMGLVTEGDVAGHLIATEGDVASHTIETE